MRTHFGLGADWSEVRHAEPARLVPLLVHCNAVALAEQLGVATAGVVRGENSGDEGVTRTPCQTPPSLSATLSAPAHAPRLGEPAAL